MKILKGLLIFIVVVAVILVAVTFMLPSKVEMERSKFIAAPQELVFNQVNNLKAWDAWSPWHELDPNIELEYSSDDPSGEGAWYSWKGIDAVGSGKLTILTSEPHRYVRSQMLFMESEDPAFANMTFEEADGGTQVTWSFEAEMSGTGKWFGLMMETFLGPSYERGLDKLDSVATSLSANIPTANVKETQLNDTWYVGYIIETDQEGASDTENYAKGLGAVHQFIAGQGLEPVAPPMTVVHEWEPGSVVMELAIPVADSISVPDHLTMGRIPAGNALKLKHKGSYETLGDSWEAFEEYNAAHNVEPRWYPYEVYLTDPEQEPDTSKWVTEIVFPVK